MTAKKYIRKMPKWLFCLIGAAACFAVLCLLFGVEEHFGMGTGDPEGFIENACFYMDIIFMFAFYGFVIAAAVLIIKAIYNRATRGYKRAQEVVCAKTTDSGFSDKKTNLFNYNKDDTLQFENDSEPMTWGKTIGLLFCIFPVGLFILIRKLIHEKTRYYENGVKTIILGGFVLLIFLPTTISLIAGGDYGMFMILNLAGTVCGAAFITAGILLKRTGRVNNAYMTAITIEHVTKIDTLAAMMKTDCSGVVKTVQRLIDSDLLKGAYIYHRDGVIIVQGVSERVAVKCRMCAGTTVRYKSDKNECVYCGAEL